MNWCFYVSFLQILYNIFLGNNQPLEKASEKVTEFFIGYFESIFETNDKFNNAFLLVNIFEFLNKKDQEKIREFLVSYFDENHELEELDLSFK